MATKKSGKWIQKAEKRMEARGTKGSYGHKTAKQMRKDKRKGGAIGKKANFAMNMRKIAAKRKKSRSRKRSAHR